MEFYSASHLYTKAYYLLDGCLAMKEFEKNIYSEKEETLIKLPEVLAILHDDSAHCLLRKHFFILMCNRY